MRGAPMKTVRISDATNRAIIDAAIYPFHSTATRLPDGNWLVPVDDEVYQRIEDNRLPGESDDDVILRARHVHSGRASN